LRIDQAGIDNRFATRRPDARPRTSRRRPQPPRPALEDELAIHKVIACYGPAVDAGDGAGATAVFTDDGVYDVDVGRMEGSRYGAFCGRSLVARW
jgi:hypothetical protein